jgi:hypothetical protein
VTLRVPPPLDTALSRADGRVLAPDGTVVAEVAPAAAVDTAIPPVGYDAAVAASSGYAGFAGHPFPTCYVCGPERPDGLRIFAGPVVLPDSGRPGTAAPWVVPADVSPATVWAALDCPGGWAVIVAGRPYVLGRIAVRLDRVPEPGEQCVVAGALDSTEGRRALVHTTLYGEDGAEAARARATWVALPT